MSMDYYGMSKSMEDLLHYSNIVKKETELIINTKLNFQKNKSKNNKNNNNNILNRKIDITFDLKSLLLILKKYGECYIDLQNENISTPSPTVSQTGWCWSEQISWVDPD